MAALRFDCRRGREVVREMMFKGGGGVEGGEGGGGGVESEDYLSGDFLALIVVWRHTHYTTLVIGYSICDTSSVLSMPLPP